LPPLRGLSKEERNPSLNDGFEDIDPAKKDSSNDLSILFLGCDLEK